MPGRWQTITRTLQHDELEKLRWMSRHHPNTGRGSSGADARAGSRTGGVELASRRERGGSTFGRECGVVEKLSVGASNRALGE